MIASFFSTPPLSPPQSCPAEKHSGMLREGGEKEQNWIVRTKLAQSTYPYLPPPLGKGETGGWGKGESNYASLHHIEVDVRRPQLGVAQEVAFHLLADP